jgi:uncharacterized membrane-anchored protein
MGKRLCAPLFALLFLVMPLPALSASPPASSPAPSPKEAALAAAIESAQKAIQHGPQDVPLSGQATLSLPADFGFVPPAEAAQYLRALGNTPGESLAGLVVPLEAQKGDWLVVINYVPSGYIKDDEAKEWDADELLESIRAGTEEDNKQRAQMGIPEMEIIGWVEKPIYDDQTKRLVWSISSRGKGQPAAADNGINYNTYALGREGYYSLNLVTGQSTIAQDKPAVHTLLAALQYNEGKRYENFDAGTDKVAEYGLTALVAGVAAKKLGLLAMAAVFFAKFWKLLLIGVFGIGVLAKKLVAKKAA